MLNSIYDVLIIRFVVQEELEVLNSMYDVLIISFVVQEELEVLHSIYDGDNNFKEMSISAFQYKVSCFF